MRPPPSHAPYVPRAPKTATTVSSYLPPWFPSDPNDRLHILMISLHAAGAIGAFIMSMYCDVLPANQQAMIPRSITTNNGNHSISLPPNISEALLFRAGFPWSQDEKFTTHVWNPYLLVVVFEWLTAAFALCTPLCWREKAKTWVEVWLGLGAVAVVMWFMRHYILYKTPQAVFPWAMAIILTLSFSATGNICYDYLEHCENIARHQTQPDQEPPTPDNLLIPPATVTPDDLPEKSASAITRRVVVQGREWAVPKTVGVLKPGSCAQNHSLKRRGGKWIGEEWGSYVALEPLEMFVVAAYDTGFRYVEYCVTAPLLFLAVTALLTVDAPAWLYLSGYWLIQACNAAGLAYHATICTDLYRDGRAMLQGQNAPTEPTSLVEWMRALLANGSWHDRGMQHAYLLEISWLCLLLPIGGLVYMVRHWITSTEVPWIASMMIWLLLVMYCSFGIVPSVVYSTYRRDMITKLPWLLDILNLAAKFPIPILILIAFSTRPNGFHTCSM